jgi:two-component system sensor histidine kinase EvgS
MQMKARHPDIHWQEVENSSVALNLVATGKVDAAISNQLTARYLSEHYYPDRLAWLPLRKCNQRQSVLLFPAQSLN